MFKVFKEEIENGDIVDIIREKIVKLYETHETVIQDPYSEDTKETRNICHQPFPLEYYLDVSNNIRRENFYKCVKYGDILHSRILSYRSSGHYFVNIFASVGSGKTRNLIDCDVVAHMKSDDTDPDVKDSDVYGNWQIKTHLIVEVLDVKNLGGNPRLHVGTKGTTLDKYQRKKVLLGKVTEPFPITEASWDERNPSYSKALLRCKTFNRAKSTKILCQHFNLNFRMHSSSANNIRNQNLESSQSDTDNDPDIEVILSSSDSEDIQVTKVELSSKQKADNLIREAISNYRDCKYKNALEKLESVFAIDPRNTMAIVALGVNTYRLGDSDRACMLLTRALNLDPDNIDAIIAKASILSNNGELDEALELLDPAIKQDPMRIKTKYNKAKSYYSKIAAEKASDFKNNGNKQEAIRFYRKALHVDPQNIEVVKALSLLRKKGDSVELICLSSDEDDNIMDTCPTEILRSQASREQEDLSDDDPENDKGHMDNSYNMRVKQFLQHFPRSEEIDLSQNQNQNIIDTDTNENGSERGTSERESGICEQDCRVFKNNDRTEKNDNGSEKGSDICEQDCRVFNNNDRTETNENRSETGTSERGSDICEQDFRGFNNDVISESHEFENTKKNESIDKYDDKLERTVLIESNDCEQLNISVIEKPITMLSEELKERDVTKSCQGKNSQTNFENLEEVCTNNKIADNQENENAMKKLPKKRTLPKLKRLPVGYRIENNSFRTMRPHDNQDITNQEESSKTNQSPLNICNEKEMSNRLIGSNFSTSNLKENKAQYSGNDNDSFELANVERTVPNRVKSYKKLYIIDKTDKSKSDDNGDTQYFKVRNAEDVNKTRDLSKKDKNFYKNSENNKKKYEEAVINKSRNTGKHKNSHNNKEDINKKSKNKNSSDKFKKRNSRSSKDSFKKKSHSNESTMQMIENDSDIHSKKGNQKKIDRQEQKSYQKQSPNNKGLLEY